MCGLKIDRGAYEQMVAHCLDAYPLEGCGLLSGPISPALSVPAPASADGAGTADRATTCHPTANAAASARVYTIDPGDHLRADREADRRGEEIIAVFHSHTHTKAYPSPTDVAQAPVPEWHYVLVSLAGVEPVVRSYRIVDGKIDEEPVVVDG